MEVGHGRPWQEQPFWKGGDKTLTEMKWNKKGEKLNKMEVVLFRSFIIKGSTQRWWETDSSEGFFKMRAVTQLLERSTAYSLMQERQNLWKKAPSQGATDTNLRTVKGGGEAGAEGIRVPLQVARRWRRQHERLLFSQWKRSKHIKWIAHEGGTRHTHVTQDNRR